MAKAQRISRPDEPNLIVPLATSINERGVKGFTHSVTNSEDQRKLNCFYELSKNPMTGKGTLVLSKRPGVTLGTGTYGASGQTAYLALNILVDGAVEVLGVFHVTGTAIKFSITASPVTILDPIGNYLPFTSDITAISNVRTLVFQMRRVAGATGGTHRVFYITSSSASTLGAWTEITDADFTGYTHAGKMEHLDGYAFILTDSNLIINSDTNSLANWTATNFLAKQIKQDRASGLARLRNQILAFGNNTFEVFYNAGNTTGSPLGRIAHQHEQIGLVQTALSGGTHYYTTIDDRIYFVGRRSGGSSEIMTSAGRSPSLSAFSYDGTRFEKIGTPYIDKILSEKYDSIYSVNSIGFGGQIGVVICVTAPGISPQRSFVFFPDWKEWFEWTSTVFSPVNAGEQYLGLGSLQHKLYSFAMSDNWQDDGSPYQWFTQFKLPNKGTVRRFMPMYGVEADTARSTNSLTVEISTDDCQSFSTLGTIDLTQDRKLAFRGGSFRTAHIRLGNTNSAETRIQNFLARIE